MVLSRRALLAAGVGAWGVRAPGAGAAPAATTVLRVGVLQPPEAIGNGWSEALGIQLGAEETARTAALLGASIAWSSREPGSPSQAAAEAAALAVDIRAHAILAALEPEAANAAAEGAQRKGLVFLPLGAGGAPQRAAPGLSFRVGLAAPARERAVALVLRRAGIAAAAVRLPTSPPAPGEAIAACVWATEWSSKLERYGADQLNRRFALRFARPMDGRAWCGWAAVKALAEAALRARPADPQGLAAALRRTAFDGHKGASLSFRASDRRLVQPACVVGRLPADGPGEPRLLAELDAEEIDG